jgi:hypothetical protein
LQIIEERSLIEKILKNFSYKGISDILSKRRVTGRHRGKVVAEPTDRGKRETMQNCTEEVKAKTGGTEKRVFKTNRKRVKTKKSKPVRELLDKLFKICPPNVVHSSATVRQTMLRNNITNYITLTLLITFHY